MPGPAQGVKDPAVPQLWRRSQLQLRSDPWPRSSGCHRVAKKGKKGKKNQIKLSGHPPPAGAPPRPPAPPAKPLRRQGDHPLGPKWDPRLTAPHFRGCRWSMGTSSPFPSLLSTLQRCLPPPQSHGHQVPPLCPTPVTWPSWAWSTQPSILRTTRPSKTGPQPHPCHARAFPMPGRQ